MVREGSSASRQRPWQRYATVDHSDIRGLSASTRHHGRDPSGAAFRLAARIRPWGYRIELDEGSPLPRATTAAVRLRFAPTGSGDLLARSDDLLEWELSLPLHLDADVPDKAKQLTAHGRDRLLLAFTATYQSQVTLMQAVLRLPGGCDQGGVAAPLAGRERRAHCGAVSVGPGPASITMRRRCALPALLIAPRQTRGPLECSRESAPE